jgi:CheY-like chemotaxis protein
VLLAQDCLDPERLCLTFLQGAGAEVTLECSGQSAVDAVRKSPTLIDAVVIDFKMPKLDGLDATNRLRELGYRGPIIAVTAFSSAELKHYWLQAGCDEYLKKPLNEHEFISAVLRHTAAAKKAV